MEINLNGTKIDWVKMIPRNLSGEVTKHTVQGGARPDISSYVNIENRVVKLECLMSEGDVFFKDKEDRFQQLLKMGKNKEIIRLSSVTFSFFSLFSDSSAMDETFVITSIEERDKGDNFISFGLTLEEVRFAKLKTVQTSIQPSKSLSTAAAKKDTVSKSATKKIVNYKDSGIKPADY
ncbi:MAG: phage baseplate protein [Fusobacteriaceae bacterium]